MPKIKIDDDVSVVLPDKLKHLKAKKLPKGPRPPKGRLVSAFMIYHPDDPDKELMKFEEAFELRVRYTHADELRAGEEPLQIQYDAGKGWKLLETKLEPNGGGNGGIGVAIVTAWDPQIGWFP